MKITKRQYPLVKFILAHCIDHLEAKDAERTQTARKILTTGLLDFERRSHGH